MAVAAESRRLSFGEDRLHVSERLHSQDTLTALSDPNLDTFSRAVQTLSRAVEERLSRIEAAAHSRTDPTGDSNPKVVQRHYDTMKNTYMNLEMKQNFLDALLDRRPSDQDTTRLADAEQELADAAKKLKDAKGQSKQHLAELTQSIDNLAALYTAFGAAQDAAEQSLESLEDLEHHLLALAPQEPPTGSPVEVELKAMLAAEADRAHQSEAALASTQAEIAELQAAKASEEDEVAALRNQAQALEATLQNRQSAGSGTARFEEYIDWCEEMTDLHTQLSGIAILNVTKDMVRLRINTMATLSEDAQQVAEIDHLLLAQMDAGTGRLLTAELVPPAPIDLSSLIDQAEGSLALLVRHIQAKLADKLHQDAHPGI